MQAVSRSASFLAEKIIYKASEAFDDEMESSMEDVKEIIGGRRSKMLAAQAHNSGSSTSKPRVLFVRIIFQILILNFCVSEITRAASLVSKTLVSSLHTDFFDSGSPNYSSIRYLK